MHYTGRKAFYEILRARYVHHSIEWGYKEYMIKRIIRKLRRVFRSRFRSFFWREWKQGGLKWVPDVPYLHMEFRYFQNRKLNLRSPKTFNEKIQWLKLHDRRPIYSTMVDKYEAKRFIAERIGEGYTVPSIGVWDSFSNIDFELLPQRFVLKGTHDYNSVVICTDKEKFDRLSAERKLNASLQQNHFYSHREWAYKNVKPRILAEVYLDGGESGLSDYKVHCFNGEPKLILVCQNRFGDEDFTEDFYSTEWSHMNISRPGVAHAENGIDRPAELERMLAFSRCLAKGTYFLRVDFYLCKDRIYVGELTFYPAGGITPFEPKEADEMLGSWLKLPI